MRRWMQLQCAVAVRGRRLADPAESAEAYAARVVNEIAPDPPATAAQLFPPPAVAPTARRRRSPGRGVARGLTVASLVLLSAIAARPALNAAGRAWVLAGASPYEYRGFRAGVPLTMARAAVRGAGGSLVCRPAPRHERDECRADGVRLLPDRVVASIEVVADRETGTVARVDVVRRPPAAVPVADWHGALVAQWADAEGWRLNREGWGGAGDGGTARQFGECHWRYGCSAVFSAFVGTDSISGAPPRADQQLVRLTDHVALERANRETGGDVLLRRAGVEP